MHVQRFDLCHSYRWATNNIIMHSNSYHAHLSYTNLTVTVVLAIKAIAIGISETIKLHSLLYTRLHLT